MSPLDPQRRRSVPAGTYRLQVTADFTLDDAAAVAGYLADLGVTHAYSSPLLRSAAGSTHGYDTVDHAHVDEPRGGREGLDRFVAQLHEHGLGLGLGREVGRLRRDRLPHGFAPFHPGGACGKPSSRRPSEAGSRGQAGNPGPGRPRLAPGAEALDRADPRHAQARAC